MDKESERLSAAFCEQHGRNVFSQAGEDGCLATVFDHIGVTNRVCFEVGAADGVFCSNTKRLREQGWQAILIEADPERYARLRESIGPNEVAVHAKLSLEPGETLDDVLASAGCPEKPDLGVIDIDGADYHVWNSLLRHRPRVMVVEYDRRADKDRIPLVGEEGANGCGLHALVRLAAAKSYSIVGHTQFNAILIDRDAIPPAKATSESSTDKAERTPEPAAEAAAPAETRKPIRLNIGGGAKPLPGAWVLVDRKEGGEAYPIRLPNTPANQSLLDGRADFHRDKFHNGSWTLRDNSVDEIYASHVLEHFGHREVPDVLKEWTRVLKFGGTLKLAVPDLEWIARNYLEGKPVNVQGYLMGGQMDADDYHRCMFDREMLVELLQGMGYRDIRPWTSAAGDCAALPCSLNLQATKWYRIKPLMSMPRLSFTANWKSWIEALMPFGLTPSTYEGAYWDQCLDRVMEQEMPNADLLLTLDYDTPLTADVVRGLIDLMHRHPEADAIAAVQMGRGRSTPLMTVNDAEGKVAKSIPRVAFDAELVKAATAHFGATIIRTSALAKVPRPWFQGVPNAEGRWGEGRVDPDIWFWRQWEKAGNSLYVAPDIVVGHGQYVWIFPDQDLAPIHQDTQEFFKSGPPAGVFRRQGAVR